MFTVVVDEAAKADLEAVWVAVGLAGKSEARRALEAINDQLTTAPFEQSESREGAQRIMVILPVAVRYVVHETISRVNVVNVWYVRRRGQA
jgi:plasmid stabilization system protein ParE